MICIGFPNKTDADYLIESQCVVIASCDVNDPFRYAPCETLKGTFDGNDIDLLVDSVTRRVLQANPNRRVVLLQHERGGPWRHLGIASDAYESIVRRIVTVSADWQGSDGASRRLQFFMPLFGHDDPNIRQLAYLEMGRAPYPAIKQLGRIASRDDYAPMLTEFRYVEWRSLAILLLAQSDDPKDKQSILDSFYSTERVGLTSNLAAWVAAAIEVDGESAIRFIENHYFRRTDRNREELQAVMKALSMHGSQPNAELQNRIVDSYRVLLEHFPVYGPQVADDLFGWERSELTDVLSIILNSGEELDQTGKRSIGRYLHAAASREELALVRD